MSFKFSLNVSQLPPINGRYSRGYALKPLSELPSKLKFIASIRFDLLDSLRESGLSSAEKVGMLKASMRCLEYFDLQADLTVELAKQLFPYSDAVQHNFCALLAEAMHPRDPISLAEFVYAIGARSHPGDQEAMLGIVNAITSYINFGVKMDKDVYSNRIVRRLSSAPSADMELARAKAGTNKAAALSELEESAITAAVVLSSDLLHQIEFVASLVKECYPDSPELQRQVVAAIAKRLYSSSREIELQQRKVVEIKWANKPQGTN